MKNGKIAPPGYVLPNRPRWQGGLNLRSVFGAAVAFTTTASAATEWLTLCSATWVCFYSRRYLPLSAVAALAALALPPLSLVTVAHPLIAAGHWFPGTRWFGLWLAIILIAAYRRFGTSMTLVVLIAASIATHARFHRPFPDPHILAVDTHFGGQSPQNDVSPRFEMQEQTIQQIALAHPDTLLVFPESIIPNWNGMHEARWASAARSSTGCCRSRAS
jgi:hypothetical protein